MMKGLEAFNIIQLFGVQPDSDPDFYLQTVAKPDFSNECSPEVQLIHV